MKTQFLTGAGALILGYLLAVAIFPQPDSSIKVSSDTQPLNVERDSANKVPIPSTSGADVPTAESSDNWNGIVVDFASHANSSPETRALWKRVHSLSDEEKIELLLEALEYENRSHVQQLVSTLIYTVAKENAALALTAFESMSPRDQSQIGSTFIMGWANGDPNGVWDWLDNVDRTGTGAFLRAHTILQTKQTALGAILSNANSPYDPLELVLNENDLLQAKRLRGFVIGELMKKDLNETIDLMTEHPQLGDVIVEKAIQHWARTDLPEAVRFLQENADVATPESVSVVADKLIQSGGIEFLSSLYSQLEQPELKDQVAINAVVHLASDDFETAVVWFESIEDVKIRRNAGSAIVRQIGFDENMDTHIQFLESSFGHSSDARPVYVHSLREWQKISPDKVIEYVDRLPTEAAELRAQLNWQLDLGLDE